MKNSTKYKAWRVIIDSIEGVEVKEDTENNQIVAIKENDIIGLFDLELDAGSIKERNENLMEMARIGPNRSGIDGVVIWIGESPDSHGPRIKVSNLKNKWDKQNNFTLSLPDLAVKAGQPEKWIPLEDIRDFLKLNMNSIVSYEKEGYDTDIFLDSLVPISGSIKESWLSDDYVTWVDDSSKAKTFTQAEAEIVAKQVNGLVVPRFPDGEETDSYVVSNINQYESTELQVRNTFHNRDTHPFYLKIDENGQWWIVNKRTGKQHKPSKNDKETAREEAKVMRKNDPFVESIKEAVSKSEIELVKQVTDYTKTNKLRLPNPNYLETKFYSPQWKALGAYIYYQLPNKTIIAILNRATGETKFNPNGLHKPLI